MNDYEGKTFSNEDFAQLHPYQASEFINCTFNLVDFTSINLSLSKFIECHFIRSNLSNISLKNSTFRDINFNECKLIGLNWSEVQLLFAPSFIDSILDFCVFQSLKLNGVHFKNCSLKEVDFDETNLTKALFSESNLSKSTFTKANLSQADFRNAYNYFIDPKETNIKKAIFNLPEALNLLHALDITLE